MQVDPEDLRKYMEEHGLTQEAVASCFNVSQASIHRVLVGKGIRSGPAQRRIAEGLFASRLVDREYSSRELPRDLAAKLAQMCKNDDEAERLGAVLDALAAYCGRNVK